MFEYLICAICPVSGDYEPGEPECGFLFPAYMDGGAAMNYVDVYQKNQEYPHTELLKLLGLYEIDKIFYNCFYCFQIQLGYLIKERIEFRGKGRNIQCIQ